MKIFFEFILNLKMFNIILACTKEWGVGYKNKLPWNVPEELKKFKNITQNSVVVMGRKTIEELPILKDRELFCLTKKTQKELMLLYKQSDKCKDCFLIGKNIVHTTTISKLLKIQEKEIFIAGGAMIYDYIFSNFYFAIKKIYLSFMEKKYECDSYIKWRPKNHNWIIDKKIQYNEFSHYELVKGSSQEEPYLSLVTNVLDNGWEKVGRNGKTKSVFGKTLEFDLTTGFPLLTTKKMFFRGIVEELLFFIRGDTNSKLLEDKKINIWKGNTDRKFLDSIGKTNRKEGMMGPMYGWSWRHFNAQYNENTGKPKRDKGLDQLQEVVNLIRTDPQSRRILLTDYNPLQAKDGVLYPCHSVIIQFYVQGGYLDMFCFNRSSDLFHGLPFNIASSSLFLILIAKITNLIPRKFILSLGDCHIYEQHYKMVEEQLTRLSFNFPTLEIKKDVKDIGDLEKMVYSDFKLINYQSHPSIKAPMIA